MNSHRCWKCLIYNELGDRADQAATWLNPQPVFRCWKCGHLNNGSALTDDTVIIGKQPTE